MLKNTLLLDVEKRVDFWISEGDKSDYSLCTITGYSDYTQSLYADFKDIDLYGIVMDGDFEEFLANKNIEYKDDYDKNIIYMQEGGINYTASILKVPVSQDTFVLGEDEEDYYEYILQLSSLTVESLCEISTSLNKSEAMKLWVQEGLRMGYSLEDTDGEYLTLSDGTKLNLYGVYYDSDFEEMMIERGIKVDYQKDKDILHLKEKDKEYSLNVYNIENRFDEDNEDELIVQLSSITSCLYA